MFKKLIAEGRTLAEGGGSRASKAMRQNKFYNHEPSDFARRAPDEGSFRHRSRAVVGVGKSPFSPDDLANKGKEYTIFGKKYAKGPAQGTVRIGGLNGRIQRTRD